MLRKKQFPDDPKPLTSFIFQKKRFIYNPEIKKFEAVVFPIDIQPPLSHFQHSRGITSKAGLDYAEKDYGFNRFDIPVPTFEELFKEHAVAPFFVFQIFCVGLWCLDEYWYYSLFTLFMLVVFESTVVWQRLRTLSEFRTMGIKPYPVYTYRCEKWTEILSDELFPGDLISIVRTKEDSGLPCDAILVTGGCIVNEAMLSGESTPLLKESVALRPADEKIDVTGLDKNSCLYGGTKVLQTTPAAEKGEIEAPDGGVLAVVTRTGFETSQGSLVRTMIYSTERVSANNFEALLFILFLLVFAIAASWYVWVEGNPPKPNGNMECDRNVFRSSTRTQEIKVIIRLHPHYHQCRTPGTSHGVIAGSKHFPSRSLKIRHLLHRAVPHPVRRARRHRLLR